MVNYEVRNDMIILSFFDERGDIKFIKIPLSESQKFKWVLADKNDPYKSKKFVSHEDKPVKKVRTRGINKYRLIEILESLPDNYKNKIFNMNNPKKWFMDIETEVIDFLPSADDPKEKILTTAFCDQVGNAFAVGLKQLSEKQIKNIEERINDHIKDVKLENVPYYKFKYKHYQSEALMLSELMNNYASKMPFISGWNFVNFDWAYMMARSERLKLNISNLSPTKRFYDFMIKDKWDRDNKRFIKMPYHKLIVDYSEIYNKWDTYVKIKESGKLDWVAEKVLGVKKIQFNGSLMKLYESDFETYVFYNIIDSILVSLIDIKLGTYNTMKSIAYKGHVQVYDAFFASQVIENAVVRRLLQDNKVMAGVQKHVKEKYPGGWVKEPQKGVKEYVMVVDFESEFPSIVMSMNTGPDTLIGELTPDKENIITTSGNMIPFTNKDRCITTATGHVYQKYDENGNIISSIMRDVTWDFFKDRVFSKKSAKVAAKNINKLKEMLSDTTS